MRIRPVDVHTSNDVRQLLTGQARWSANATSRQPGTWYRQLPLRFCLLNLCTKQAAAAWHILVTAVSTLKEHSFQALYEHDSQAQLTELDGQKLARGADDSATRRVLRSQAEAQAAAERIAAAALTVKAVSRQVLCSSPQVQWTYSHRAAWHALLHCTCSVRTKIES